MTVKELRDALAACPDDAPVVCEGTSVAVYPSEVIALSELLADEDASVWAFQNEPDNAVVILTS